MKAELLTTVHGTRRLAFDDVTEITSACVDGHILIVTTDANFIFALQPGETLKIIKDDD